MLWHAPNRLLNLLLQLGLLQPFVRKRIAGAHEIHELAAVVVAGIDRGLQWIGRSARLAANQIARFVREIPSPVERLPWPCRRDELAESFSPAIHPAWNLRVPARMNTLLFVIHPGKARKGIVGCSSRVDFCRRHKFSPPINAVKPRLEKRMRVEVN